MKGWVKCNLGDALNLKRGFDLPERNRIDGKYPIVSSGGITGHHNVAMVNGPGVVTGRYGTIGEVYYISEDFWPLNTSLYVENFKGNSKKYITFLLQTYLSANQNAAGAVPGVNRNHLHKIKINLPPLPIQRKIAAVLSAYDDLIETNNRRIAILEKMAEELYREWFVRLRFPGHNSVGEGLKPAPTKGVPEDWEVKRIKEVIDRKSFGRIFRESELQPEGKVIVIDQSVNEYLGFYDGDPEHCASEDRPIMLFGDHSCKMQIMIEPFSLAENVIPFVAKGKMPTAFLFYMIHNSIETTEYKRHWTELVNKEVYIPQEHLQIEFAKIVITHIHQKEKLIAINRRTKIIRDCLLARLMSGKINVEHLDIEFPKSMINEADAEQATELRRGVVEAPASMKGEVNAHA